MKAQLGVVIAIRNRSGQRLANCLHSLRWQSVAAHLQIVLSDFGSDPEHANSIDQLAAQHAAVVARTATDEVWNRSRALNIGIQACATPLVMCTDADMIFAPDFMAEVLSALDKDDKALVVSRCHDLPESVSEQPWQVSDFAALRDKSALRDTTGTGACQATRKAFFEHVRGYDEAFKYWGAEDDDMLSRAQEHGLRVTWLPDTTSMLHQWHPTMKNDRWLQRKVNEWRLKLTQRRVIKNPSGWGNEGPAGRSM